MSFTQDAARAAQCPAVAFKDGMMSKAYAAGLSTVVAILCGCASSPIPPASPSPAAPAAPAAPVTRSTPVAPAAPAASGTQVAHYRCDREIEFTVRFTDDSVVIDSKPPLGNETLLRDAGGVTPQQTVYSNTRMRAEFGLGANGREAIVRVPGPPLVAHCTRD